MATTITEKEVRDLVKGKLARYYGVSPVEATKDQIYKAVVMSVRDILLQKRQVFSKRMTSFGQNKYYATGILYLFCHCYKVRIEKYTDFQKKSKGRVQHGEKGYQ